MSNFSTQNEESCSKTNRSKFPFALGDLMSAIPNCSGTATNQNKAFFLLCTTVADAFEFKEILCFHSFNCIGIQIAFIFKLKASLTFPIFLHRSSISLTVNTGIPYKDFPHYIFRSSKLIGILSSTLLRRHCNISFSETSVAMPDFMLSVISVCLQSYHIPSLFHEN